MVFLKTAISTSGRLRRQRIVVANGDRRSLELPDPLNDWRQQAVSSGLLHAPLPLVLPTEVVQLYPVLIVTLDHFPLLHQLQHIPNRVHRRTLI